MDDIRAFVNNLWLHANTYNPPEYMTEEEAQIDIDNFIAEEWELPEGFTAQIYKGIWNEYVNEYYEGDDNYTRSATHGDYSPSSPWLAPGMSVSDFI